MLGLHIDCIHYKVTTPKKSCYMSFQSAWPKEYKWYHWWCCRHCVMPMVSIIEEVMLHLIFIVIELRNALVSLMMLLALSYADAGANDITWIKMSSCISFWTSWAKKWTGAIDDTGFIMWHWHQDQWHYMTKKLCCTSFQLSWLM